MARSPVMRSYIRIHFLLSVAYVALVAIASWFIPDDAEPSAMVILFAILPGLCVLGWIWNMGRLYINLEDEYLRMLEVRKAMWATAITLGISGGWGLIELFSIVPRLPVFFIFPIWCLGLAVGSILNKIEFGTSGETLT